MHAVYDELPDVLADLGLAEVDAVLFDLGVSSMQLDVRERGFAYAEDAPLDMRMDGSTGPTAADVLNTYPAAELTRVLRDYGEEKFARKIAAAVVRQREQQPFTTSARLVELLYAEIPAPARRTGGHPAKRTFQALRMEVNDELAVLRRAIPAAIDAISVGGRVVVESYHSLEDRLVKQAFTAVTRSRVPEDLPFVPAGQRAAAAAGHPRRRAGRRRRDRAEPPRRLRPAPGRRTSPPAIPPAAPPGSRIMSSPAVQPRSRVPRIAEAAVERARLTVVPRRRTRPAARMPFVTLVSLVLLGGVVGLLLFNTSMQQSSFAATALEEQAEHLSARQQTLEMELEELRDPQRVAAVAQGQGMVLPAAPAMLDLETGEVPGEALPATADSRPRLVARAPRLPRVLNPPAQVVTVTLPPEGTLPAESRDRDTSENNGRRGRGGGRNG